MTCCSLRGSPVAVWNNVFIKITVGCFNLYQNLNKQAYDLAKTLLKRTVQTIETCIANVSSANCDSLGRLCFPALDLVSPSACTNWCPWAKSFYNWGSPSFHSSSIKFWWWASRQSATCQSMCLTSSRNSSPSTRCCSPLSCHSWNSN